MTDDTKHFIRIAKRRCLDGTAKVICRAANLTLEDVARRAGATKFTVHRWLDASSLPTGDRAVMLGRLLEECLPQALENLDQEALAAEQMRKDADAYHEAVALLRKLVPSTTSTLQAA